jgi:hypothetical protein
MTGGPFPPEDLRPCSGLREGFVAVDVVELMELLVSLDSRIHVLCSHGEGGPIEPWYTCGADVMLLASRWQHVFDNFPEMAKLHDGEAWREYSRRMSGPNKDGKTTPWRSWKEPGPCPQEEKNHG